MMRDEMKIVQISVGWLDHALALRNDGVVLAWGNNDSGQCNIPDTLSDVMHISAGYTHSIVRCRDASIIAWGANKYGECSIPVEVDIYCVASVVAGHNCTWGIMHDGTVHVWGNKKQLQCQIPPNLPPIQQLVSGRWHTLALSYSGQIFAWGASEYGQCVVPSHLDAISHIATGGKHSLALTHDGMVWAWGDNTYGQCQVPPYLTNVVQISAGEQHSVALCRDGSVVIWGDNSWGQSQLLTQSVPIVSVVAGRWLTIVMGIDGLVTACGSRRWYATVPNNLERVTYVDGGQYHIAALTTNQTVISWGRSQFDILMSQSQIPPISVVDVSDSHGLALTYHGNVIGWGLNNHGQCTMPIGLSQIVQVAAGGSSSQGFSLALNDAGTVYAWGNNEYGQCNVPFDLHNVVYIAAGKEHSLAITRDTRVVAWGRNDKNQCRVPHDLNDVICVKAGATHSVALLRNGQVKSWGSNRYHQCDVPKGLENVIQIDAGAYFTIARTIDNRILVWGDNEYGVCDVPVWLHDVQHFAAAYTYVIALLRSGQLVVWGNNSITDTDRLIQIGTSPRLQYIHPFAAYEGGEAKLFSTPSGLLKKYHTPEKTPALAKLQHIIAHPVTLTHADRPLIIWPQELAYHPFTGELAGYVMPFVAATQLIDVLDRTKRITRWPDLATDPRREWQFVLNVARWSAAVLAHIHAHGYVVGDLSPRNILVYDEGTVAFVDCDSYQVGDGSMYSCSVSTAGYRAPEVRQRAHGRLQYSIHSDAFALAVAIFRLLCGNLHPYQGITLPSATLTPAQHRATKQQYPHLQPIPDGVDATTYCYERGVWPYDVAQQICEPPVEMQEYYLQLPAAVRGLFGRAFTGAPAQRPTPLEWVHVLDAWLGEVR
jgi:hypothetical protein